ncbi:MAG: MlaD family protein [Pseudomonadota bacterium]
METRANFAIVGAMVIAAVIAFAAFVLWLGQSQFNRDYDVYDIVFDGPISLEAGAGVRFNGINVGEVESVSIDRENESKVRTRIRVDSTTPVRENSTALIDFAGITGTTFVQVKAGTKNSPLVDTGPNDPVHVIAAEPTLLSELFSGSADVLRTATESAARFNSALSDVNLANFGDILKNLNTFTDTIASDDRLLRDTEAALSDISEAAIAVEEAAVAFLDVTNDVDREIVSVAAEARGLLQDLRGTVEKVNMAVDNASMVMTSADGLIKNEGTRTVEDLGLASQDLRRLIYRIDGLVRELEQHPEALVLGNPQPYEENN